MPSGTYYFRSIAVENELIATTPPVESITLKNYKIYFMLTLTGKKDSLKPSHIPCLTSAFAAGYYFSFIARLKKKGHLLLC